MKKLLTVVGALIVLAIIVVGIGNWAGQNKPAPEGGPTAAPTPELVNPPGCADWELISIPGTWESSPADDPTTPTANPNSLLLRVTQPVQATYGPDRVKVFTVPYTAQFRNINAQGEMSYDDSRNEGAERTRAELAATHAACPATKFLLVGFSQGAVIGGDIAAEIGNGQGPIPADRFAGAALIADGRFQRDKGVLIGSPSVTGEGAEVVLNPISGLVQPIVPGATMRGPRPQGFGEVNDRVLNFCAKDDHICDAPRDIGNAIGRAQELIQANGIHAMYATNGEVVPGQTVPEWIVGWVQEQVNGGA